MIIVMEKQRTIEIVNELLGELKINGSQLSKSLGINRPQWIYDVLNPGKKVGLSKDKVELICNVYPQISKAYLLTGNGYINNIGSGIVPQEQTQYIRLPISELNRKNSEIDELKRKLIQKDIEIENIRFDYEAKIKEKEDRIDNLNKQLLKSSDSTTTGESKLANVG